MVWTAEEESDSINVLACSDFQAPNGNNEGRLQVSAILNAMKADGITKADGLFACGDYDCDFTDTKGGINMLSHTLKSFVSNNKVFVQGNHDSANSAPGTNGLSHGGNNEPIHGGYGVFVINEDDYMWYNDDEETIKRTTQKLIGYLNEFADWAWWLRSPMNHVTYQVYVAEQEHLFSRKTSQLYGVVPAL